MNQNNSTSLKNILSFNKLFYILFAFYLIAGGWFLMSYAKRDTHLVFNEWHTSFGDVFFKYYTHVGDGITSGVVILILLLFFNYYHALLGGVSFLVTSLITQVIKRTASIPRPKTFFEGDTIPLNFVDGVDVHCCNSFPSGHTSAVFAMFCFLALISKNKQTGIIFFVAALFTAFSRIYLQQHFFIDTYVGASIGVITTTLTFFFFEKSALKQKTTWQKALLRK